MKKFLIQSILLLAVIFIALLFGNKNFVVTEIPFLTSPATKSIVIIKGTAIKVEIADSKQERSKGLSGKEKIASDEGMLFVYEKPDKYTYWMKGLAFPLDFIWIRGLTIVDLLPNIPNPLPGQLDSSLPIYQPKVEIDKVLEVPAGTIQGLDIRVGDVITIQ